MYTKKYEAIGRNYLKVSEIARKYPSVYADLKDLGVVSGASQYILLYRFKYAVLLQVDLSELLIHHINDNHELLVDDELVNLVLLTKAEHESLHRNDREADEVFDRALARKESRVQEILGK